MTGEGGRKLPKLSFDIPSMFMTLGCLNVVMMIASLIKAFTAESESKSMEHTYIFVLWSHFNYVRTLNGFNCYQFVLPLTLENESKISYKYAC